MNILPKLPEQLFAKVMLFHSHPTADMVKQSLVFRFYGSENEYGGIHGSAFDRGRADEYYERDLETLTDGRTETDLMAELSTT